MKLEIDLGNRTIKMYYHSINPKLIEWTSLPDGTIEGVITKPDGEQDLMGIGLEFDGTLDIKVIDRDRKNFDFLVVGDGLA